MPVGALLHGGFAILFNAMRKNLAIAICGIFAIICVGSAIGMYYVKTEPMEIDLMAALVGVLSILVTVLIGFQIANYFFAKDYLLKVINEKVDAKLGKITHTIKGYSLYARDKFYFHSFFINAFDLYMEALNEVIIGGDAESIDYIASKVIMVIEEMEKQNKCYIMAMYKLNYIKIANKLKGENCDRILNFILEATGVDGDGSAFIYPPQTPLIQKDEDK